MFCIVVPLTNDRLGVGRCLGGLGRCLGGNGRLGRCVGGRGFADLGGRRLFR